MRGIGVAGSARAPAGDGDLRSRRCGRACRRSSTSSPGSTSRRFRSDAPAPLLFGSIPFDPERSGHVPVPTLEPCGAIGTERPGDAASDEDDGDAAVDAARAAESEPSPPFSKMQVFPEPLPESYEASGGRGGRPDHAAGACARSSWHGRCRSRPAARWIPVDVLKHLRAVEPDGYSFAVDYGDGADARRRESRAPHLAASATRSAPTRWPGRRLARAIPEEDRENAERLGSPPPRTGRSMRSSSRTCSAALHPLCRELTYDREPQLLATANVWHLSTRFRGALKRPGSPRSTWCGRSIRRRRSAASRATRRCERHRELEPVRSRRVRGSGRVDGRHGRRGVGARAPVRGAERRAARAVRRRRASSPTRIRPRSSTRPSGSSARSSTRCAGAEDDADARDDDRRRRVRDPRVEPRQGAVPRDRRHEDGAGRVLPDGRRRGADRVSRPSDDHASVPERRGRRAVLSEAGADPAAAVGADGDDHVPERAARGDDRAGRRRAPGVDGEPRVPRPEPVAGAIATTSTIPTSCASTWTPRPACRGATCET